MHDEGALAAVLGRARALGFLGPGPVEAHVRHAQVFLEALTEVVGTVVDLGSGGGVPGLVLAVTRPDLALVLLDATAKRCCFLETAVIDLGLVDRVTVLEGRAEDLGHSALRGSADAVVARSFGPPAVVAECAAPLLRVGGRLVVSEPPDPGDRWPAGPLAELGLRTERRVGSGPSVQVLDQVHACPAVYPRRVGLPAKRPLF